MNSKPNILIVDKEETEINKFKTVLGGLYNLDVVETTTEAVNLVNSNKQKYSVIIVALDMPVLNGYLFCLSIKKDVAVRDIPIIITGNIIDFNRTEPVEGLRIGEYDRLITPCENKTILDVVEINIEKHKMLISLSDEDYIDESAGLYSFNYFLKALDIEIMKANKLKVSFNCLEIKAIEPEVKENLLSLIKNTYRYYDVASYHNDRILLLLPRTTAREGDLVVNRFNSVIYGLNTRSFYYEPGLTDVREFKSDLFGTYDVPTIP
jgi:CheY-like chemotaxis protein